MRKILMVVALGCLAYGIYAGGIDTVLQKLLSFVWSA